MSVSAIKSAYPGLRTMALENSQIYLWLVVGLLIIGLLIRLDVVYNWNKWRPETADRLGGDEPDYDNMARQVVQGYGFTWPGRVPLYPLWLASIYKMGGSYNSVAYAQAVLGVVLIALTYRLGRKIFSPAAGLIASTFMTFSYIPVYTSVRLLSENLYFPVILIVMLLLWEAWHHPGDKRFFWAGAVVGISNLIRPSLFFLPIFLLLILLCQGERRRGLRYGLIFLGASLLVVAPWITHNFFRYRAIIPLQTSNAILWQGSPEYYHLVRDEGYTYVRVWSEVIYGPDWRNHDPNSIEGDRYWTARAIDSIISEPFTYLRYAAEKLVTFWIGDVNADWGNTYIFNYEALRQLGFPENEAQQYMIALTLPIVALIAIMILYKRWRVLLPVYILLAYFTLLHAATHAEARLSAPLQPLLVVLIAGAIVTLLGKLRLKSA